MLIVTGDDALKVINRLNQHEGKFGYDVETSGLDPRRNHIVAYVLTFGPKPDDTVYVPIRHAGGGNLLNGADNFQIPDEATNWKGLNHWFEKSFAKIAADKQWEVVGHNLMFDLLFSHRHGIQFKNSKYSCTQVRQALCDEFTPSFSLDSSSRHMGVTEKKGDALYARLAELFGCEANKKSMAYYWKTAANEPVVVDYACGDGISTWELFHAQERSIDAQDMQKTWKLEQRMTRTLFRMQHRGIRIDVPYMQEARQDILHKCEQMREPFQQFGGEDGFAERSAKCVEKAYRAAGYKDENFRRTPTGKFSFAEDWMETNDLGKKLIEIRKLANLEASFIGPLLDRHIIGDHVYPNYNQLRGDEFGTITGRLSSNEPNIQQVPKHDETLSKIVRQGFIPEDDHFWASKDAKQCEPRIFAQYTGSKFLIDGYMQKPTIDLYTNLSKITGAGRQTCKKLALALFYTAGKDKAAELIGCSVAEAVKYRDQVRAEIPEIDKFNKDAAAVGSQRWNENGHKYGFIRTVTGRRLKIKDPRFFYKFGNKIVQGGNADYIKHACNEVSDYLEASSAGRLLLTCHDNIENQIHIGREDIDNEVTKIMEAAAHDDVINFNIPQEAECGTGRNWAEATFGA